jgi:hypothetical protein
VQERAARASEATDAKHIADQAKLEESFDFKKGQRVQV